MLDRLRRPAALLLTALVPSALALTACGGDGDQGLLEGFDAMTISGEPGAAPTIEWKGRLEPGEQETKVLVEGDGAEVADGDRVLVNYVVSNGWTHKTVVDTYGAEAGGFMTTVGADAEPQQVADLLTTVVRDEIDPGTTVGTRIAVTVDSLDLLGDYLGDASVSSYMAGLDIGNEDGLLIVADVAAVALDGPEGAAVAKQPAWAPAVVEKDGEPTALDFAGISEPGEKLEVATLVEGTGEAIESGDVIAANYLGQLREADKPFDESYSRDEPLSAVISEEFGTVVTGWSKALVGVKAGSRVLIRIPPADGYGDQAQGEDIPANSTLYFLIDVLGTA